MPSKLPKSNEHHALVTTNYTSASGKNGTLLLEATQKITVADAVETAVCKGQSCGVGNGNPDICWDAVVVGSFCCNPKAGQRKVDKHNVAITRLAHVESRPAGTRSQV